MDGGQVQPIPLWLDCDPGHDDAMAIILAGYNPNVQLLGISTVAGNQNLTKVTMNALDVLDAIGLSNIDVVAGQARPLMRRPGVHCPEIHGDSGLDGPSGGRLLPRSSHLPLQGVKAVDAMAKALQHAHDATQGAVRPRLVCTGALTNAALLLTLYPELVPIIDVVLMGGAMGIGNTGPVAEFNIQTDPEAAKIVFDAGLANLTMVPLEVTHTVLATPAVLAAIGGATETAETAAGATSAAASSTAMPEQLRAASPFRSAIQQLLLFFAKTYKEVFRFEDPPLHDPCAVAYVIAPEIFEVQRLRVDIEVQSPLSAGQTVCDVWRQSGLPPNCNVVTRIDVDAFWRMMVEAAATADRHSPLNAAA